MACKTRLPVTLGSTDPGGMSSLIHRWIEARCGSRRTWVVVGREALMPNGARVGRRAAVILGR